MRVTIPQLQERARSGEKLAMLTCYDASFAKLSEAAGVDILLIGDSLGMVVQGHDSTLPVTMSETEYHVRCVARGSEKALIVADMPFGSFQSSKEHAFRNAARLMAAGAQMVKLEGGGSHLHRQPGLADTAGSHQRDETGAVKQLRHSRQLLVPTDEAAEGGRQGRSPSPCAHESPLRVIGRSLPTCHH